MLIKIIHSVRAENLMDFEALLGILRETSPALGAAAPWVMCTTAAVYLLDLMGRPRAADHLLQVLAAGVRAAADHEPITPVPWHFFLALRVVYANEDPMKGLEHGEAASRYSMGIGHVPNMELAKCIIGMIRWFLGALADTDRMIMNITLADNDLGLVTSSRPFVLAWLLADRGELDEARRWADRLVEFGRTRRCLL